MRKALLMTMLAVVCSCKEEVHNNQKKPLSIEAKNAKEHSQEESLRLIECTDSVITLEKDIKQKLKQLSPADADLLYEDFTQKYYKHLAHIQVIEVNLTDNYYSWVKYDQNGNITHMPSFVKKKMNMLDKAGMEIWEEGEGMTEIRPKAYYFVNIFGKYVSPDLNEFLTLEAKDNEVLWINDASVEISWEELGEKLITWETLTGEYPDGVFIKDARYYAQFCRRLFLVGADNSPIFSYDDGTINPGVKAAFEDFIRKYPDSPTAVYVKMLLENPENEKEIHKTLAIEY